MGFLFVPRDWSRPNGPIYSSPICSPHSFVLHWEIEGNVYWGLLGPCHFEFVFAYFVFHVVSCRGCHVTNNLFDFQYGSTFIGSDGSLSPYGENNYLVQRNTSFSLKNRRFFIRDELLGNVFLQVVQEKGVDEFFKFRYDALKNQLDPYFRKLDMHWERFSDINVFREDWGYICLQLKWTEGHLVWRIMNSDHPYSWQFGSLFPTSSQIFLMTVFVALVG